jgi:hypothetical protein
MLKGAAHVHTTFSYDGKVEIRKLHALFASRGFDFVLLSEHLEHLDLTRIRQIFDTCAAVSDDRCLLIPGIEIDDLHILIFGIHRPESFTTPLALAEDAFRHRALVIVSHPVKLRRGIPDAVLPMISGVEIWNTRYDGRRAPRPMSLALFRRLQRSPERHAPGPLVPFCGMDLHRESDFSPVSLTVECAGRGAAEIVDAIRAGRVRICHHGRPIPIDSTTPAWRRAAYMLRCRAASAFYDTATGLYRRIRSFVPPALRRSAKRWV